MDGIVEIRAHALKLRLIRRHRIGLEVVEHVAHGERNSIEVILDTQQLQRVHPVPLRDGGLQFTQSGDLPGHV